MKQLYYTAFFVLLICLTTNELMTQTTQASASDGTPAVANFDAVNKVFDYRVNNSGIITPSGNPYQAQLGIRYAF